MYSGDLLWRKQGEMGGSSGPTAEEEAVVSSVEGERGVAAAEAVVTLGEREMERQDE